jgi:hypothetical protein
VTLPVTPIEGVLAQMEKYYYYTQTDSAASKKGLRFALAYTNCQDLCKEVAHIHRKWQHDRSYDSKSYINAKQEYPLRCPRGRMCASDSAGDKGNDQMGVLVRKK